MAFFPQSNAHAQGNDPQNRGCPRAMLMLRETALKTGVFPEQANGNGVMVMSKRKDDKGCLYRHTSSLGLTPTRRRSVG